MTRDKVETRLGTLNFEDGVPTVETTQKVCDNLDSLRGVEVFLNFISAASMVWPARTVARQDLAAGRGRTGGVDRQTHMPVHHHSLKGRR
jgi:hypothetical protein